MIKVVKHFRYNQNFVPRGLSALATGLYTCIKLCKFLNVSFSETALAIFPRFHMGPSVKRVLPRSTKFVQVMTVSRHLTFLRQSQTCVPMYLYKKNVKK